MVAPSLRFLQGWGRLGREFGHMESQDEVEAVGCPPSENRGGWGTQLCFLQPRIHGFAFQRKNSKDTLVHPAQRLFVHEALQSLQAQCELAHGERSFCS